MKKRFLSISAAIIFLFTFSATPADCPEFTSSKCPYVQQMLKIKQGNCPFKNQIDNGKCPFQEFQKKNSSNKTIKTVVKEKIA